MRIGEAGNTGDDDKVRTQQDTLLQPNRLIEL
jgi:hypothetical protein